MRILVVTSWYPTSDRPTYGAYVREFADALRTRFEVQVLHLDSHIRPRGRRLWEFEDVDDVDLTFGVPTLRVRWSLAPGPLPSLPLRLLASLSGYRRVRRTFRPDLIHAHVFTAGLAALSMARLSAIPLVVTEHSSIFSADAPGWASLLEARIAYRSADVVLPVSHFLSAEISKKGLSGKFVVVPNIVDLETFHPSRDRHEPARDEPLRLLFVGALRGQMGKGLYELLAALSLLNERGRDFRLTVVGDGPKRPEAEDRARDLGLSTRVSFEGGVAKGVVADLMRQSDLLVAPSVTPETFALPVAEAQASGLPVVASDIGAIPETMGAGAGLLVPPGDDVALANALDDVMKDPSRWDPEQISTGAQRFGAEAVISTVERLYGSILRGSRSSDTPPGG